MWSHFDQLCLRLWCDGWQRSHPSCGCRLGRRKALCTCQRCVEKHWNWSSPHCGGVLFNSHTITVLIMLTWLRWWIMFSLNTYSLIEFIFHHITLLLQRTQGMGTFHLSHLFVTLSLALFAIILGIKCHCFDTIAQTQKWFLKGDRAISLLLDLPVCQNKKKEAMTGSNTTFQIPSLQVHP